MVSVSGVVATAPMYTKILSKFPQNITFCFAYGSGVKKQLTSPKQAATAKMIDLIFCVDNASKWHEDNLQKNSSHYSALKYLGYNFISKLQENSGAKVYYNTLVPVEDITVKYGVISTKDLITDLLEWSDLYLAGRLHKPVEIIQKPTNNELETALQLNLQSAVHSALLILPETFTEYEFYYTISNLSYLGDFRMTFGENKNKVENIVKPQLVGFRNLYKPFLKTLNDYVDFPMLNLGEKCNKNLPELDAAVVNLSDNGAQYCSQDCSPLARLHHLNQLPRWPQKAMTRFWNRGTLRQDTEDVLRAIAYDPDCHIIVQQCISDIVWKSSVGQSLKGILTAVKKMYQFSDEDTTDSDEGVRFKTENVRNRCDLKERRSVAHSSRRSRSRSPKRKPRKEKKRKEKRRKSKRRSPSSDLSLSDENVKRKEYPLKSAKTDESSCSKRKSLAYSKDCSRKPFSHNVSKREIHSETTGEGISHNSEKSETYHKRIKSSQKFSERHAERSKIKQPIEENADRTNLKESELQKNEDKQIGHIGPLLPPNFKSKTFEEIESVSHNLGKSVMENLKKSPLAHLEKDAKRLKTKPLVEEEVEEPSKLQKVEDEQEIKLSGENEDKRQIGPSLPPHLLEKIETIKSTDTVGEKDENVQKCMGPSLPSNFKPQAFEENQIGPSLPPHLLEKIDAKNSDTIGETGPTSPQFQIGPALPPNLLQKSKNINEKVSVIGPSLPPFMKDKLQENVEDNISSDNENETEEDVYGPLPVDATIKSDAHIALEERALQIKLGKLNPSQSEAPTREEWMIELPEVKAANLGLGPRQFKKRAGADLSDRSSWTDTPQSKQSKSTEQKIDLRKEAELNSLRERDVEQEKVIKKLKKKKTDKSLLELHQDKLQEKKKKEGAKEENVRRPFSREIDLKVNRFDEAQKKAIFKKAQLLDDRFSQGQSKFL